MKDLFIHIFFLCHLFFSDRDRDRDNRSERERIRLFREREERKHLMRKRHWLEVLSDHLLQMRVFSFSLTSPALGFLKMGRFYTKSEEWLFVNNFALLYQSVKFLIVSFNFS